MIENHESILGHLDEIEKAHVSQQSINEATQFRTATTGSYITKAKKVVRRVDDRPESQDYGRQMARVQAEVFDFESQAPLGMTVFYDVSWQEKRLPNRNGSGPGRFDSATQLFMQAAKVFGPSVQDTLEGIDTTPMVTYIEESFRKLDGTWATVRADGKSQAYQDEKDDLLSKGATPRNFVRSLKALK